MSHQVLLFYKYVSLENPSEVATRVRTLAEKYELLGRAIISAEGINATFEGMVEATEAFAAELTEDSRFADLHIKKSEGDGTTFPKLVVKVRDEIVGTHLPKEEVDPTKETGKRLTADELHAWYGSNKNFTVVDMRNDYEYASGHFNNSIDPGMRASRDLPKVLSKLEPLKSKTVVTVCTGGVRCEKMSAYLLSQGFEDVYQLDGGIHTYLEKYPNGEFKGALYTFDNRVVMDFTKDRDVIGVCRLCGDKTEKYVNCLNDECHLHFLACDACQSAQGIPSCSLECKHKLESQVR